jgi:amino-acid N-acetyltransferase
VADIVFNAMVRTCLPDGVVWRSRKNNPVNKWYFERSVGTWKLPESQWCMFWTGDEVDFHASAMDSEKAERKERWNDYVNVCSGIEASWADRATKPPD